MKVIATTLALLRSFHSISFHSISRSISLSMPTVGGLHFKAILCYKLLLSKLLSRLRFILAANMHTFDITVCIFVYSEHGHQVSNLISEGLYLTSQS